MIRVNDIKSNLLHVVGWQQNLDTDALSIDSTLTGSESGIYFQQQHPLLTLTNLKAIAPDFDKVLHPELFSKWLENKTADGLYKAISTFINNKLANGTGRSIFENKVLFDGAGRLANIEANQEAIVGLEIVPARSRGISVKVNRIGLQFTGVGPITLYIMHSSSELPIKTLTLTKQKANSLEWFNQSDLLLPYTSSATDAGGSWYIVYDQRQLPIGSSAIKKDKDWSKGVCSTCSSVEYESYRAWSQYMEVHPFKIAVENTDLKLWDIQNNVYTYQSNYGINLDISVVCDITDLIIANRLMFANVISLQVACNLLREMAFNANTRVNKTALTVSKNDILYELDGDSTSVKKSGLAYELGLAYKALDIPLRGIDRICLPCNNGGIKYKTT